MENYYGWGLPFNASAQGSEIDNLIYIFHGFMGILFVGWVIYLGIALFRFRARPGHQAVSKSPHFKAPTYVEVAVALFEFFLLFAFAFPIFHRYRAELPPKDQALEIRVVAEQFAWNIHYPGRDGVFGRTAPNLVTASNPVGLDKLDPKGKDDIITINQMHVPVNKDVITYLSSKDVIHCFAIPVMRVKQDTVPGQKMAISFKAVHKGQFEIACAQLCGLGHYRMKGFFVVEGKDEFDAWLAEKERAS